MALAAQSPAAKRIAADQDFLSEPDGIRILVVEKRTA